LKDALIHREDVGSVLVRRLNVRWLELRVIVKKILMAHARPEFTNPLP
jgi:hypothetical protein